MILAAPLLLQFGYRAGDSTSRDLSRVERGAKGSEHVRFGRDENLSVELT